MTELTNPVITIGIDLGDKYSRMCVLDDTGEVIKEARLQTTKMAMRRRFAGMERARVAIEVGARGHRRQRLAGTLDLEQR